MNGLKLYLKINILINMPSHINRWDGYVSDEADIRKERSFGEEWWWSRHDCDLICLSDGTTPKASPLTVQPTLGGFAPMLNRIKPFGSFVRNLNDIVPVFTASHFGNICEITFLNASNCTTVRYSLMLVLILYDSGIFIEAAWGRYIIDANSYKSLHIGVKAISRSTTR